MDLLKIHQTLDFFIAKNSGAYFSPSEKDSVINRAQIEVFDKLKPVLGLSQDIDDALLPFKKEQTFNNGSSPAGLITLNSDYYHLVVVETVVTDSNGTHYKPVEMVNETQLSERRDSQLIPLTVYNPCGRLIAPTAANGQKRFQIYPMSASAGTVYYLRKPAEVSFSYTLGGTNNRVITYDANASTQLEWNEGGTNKVIYMALELLGLNVKDPNAIQIAQKKEAEV